MYVCVQSSNNHLKVEQVCQYVAAALTNGHRRDWPLWLLCHKSCFLCYRNQETLHCARINPAFLSSLSYKIQIIAIFKLSAELNQTCFFLDTHKIQILKLLKIWKWRRSQILAWLSWMGLIETKVSLIKFSISNLG